MFLAVLLSIARGDQIPHSEEEDNVGNIEKSFKYIFLKSNILRVCGVTYACFLDKKDYPEM